jgi:hypothetical protein
MLGRQSDLIVTNQDLATLDVMLRARGDVQFLSSRTNEGRNALLPLKSLPVAPEDSGVRQICYLGPTAWKPHVVIKPASDIKVYVRPENSDVVELWRPYASDGSIRPGRVFYTPRYWDGELVEKSAEFVKWAERLVRAIRKSLTHDKALGAYVGEDAARKIASGELRVIR